ncbi:helix-turn-helix transcriptional regulator [Catellatospora coxensis]
MRADRLLSIVLLLQSRGRQTAHQLAAELEVSARTIYRDMQALGTAGIPVYGDATGYGLVDGYRTQLTGLTPPKPAASCSPSCPGSPRTWAWPRRSPPRSSSSPPRSPTRCASAPPACGSASTSTPPAGTPTATAPNTSPRSPTRYGTSAS